MKSMDGIGMLWDDWTLDQRAGALLELWHRTTL